MGIIKSKHLFHLTEKFSHQINGVISMYIVNIK